MGFSRQEYWSGLPFPSPEKSVTFIQARKGDSRPNDKAERREGSGRLHSYREVCGSDKGNVNQVGYFEYSFVEMTFIVG